MVLRRPSGCLLPQHGQGLGPPISTRRARTAGHCKCTWHLQSYAIKPASNAAASWTYVAASATLVLWSAPCLLCIKVALVLYPGCRRLACSIDFLIAVICTIRSPVKQTVTNLSTDCSKQFDCPSCQDHSTPSSRVEFRFEHPGISGQ